MLTDCLTCIHFDRCDQEDRWYGCINYKPEPMTNADRIRSMTDEELARFIANERGRFCDFKDPSDEEYPKVLYWLKQECES